MARRVAIIRKSKEKPKATTRGRAYVAPATTSREYDVPLPRGYDAAAERKKIRERKAREERERREQAHREEKRAKGQGRVWAAEQTLDPLDFLTKPSKTREPEAIAPYRPGMAPQQQRDARRAAREEARRRRQAAKLGVLPLSKEERKKYPVIGDPQRFLVETMDPVRRRQLEERAVPRGEGRPSRERRTPTKGETQAAGFAGPIAVPGGGLFSEVWGDVQELGTGLYGSAVDYGEALYADIRHPQLEKGPLSRTATLAAKDVLNTIGAAEATIPEPSFLPEWMRKEIIHVDPERLSVARGSWEIDPTDVSRAKQAWTHDPLLSALLYVPAVGGVTRAASVGTLRRSISRANPDLPRATVNRLARKESRRPGYAAGQGYGGGIAPRMLGDTGVAGRPLSRSPMGRGVQRSYDFASDLVERYLGPNARDLSRLGQAGQLAAGRWATSRRGARAVERGQRKAIAREAAEITRAEQTIRRGGGKTPEYQQALIAALEAPKTISPREAVQLKIRHLASLETPQNRLAIQGQIAQLQRSLEGRHLESPKFEAALDSMVALSDKAEGLARTVMGMTDDQLLDRRNRVMYAWQSAGLLDEGVGPARGWFPHRGINEVVPSSMTPTGVAATGRTVGRPFVTSAVQARKQNRMKLYERGAVNTNPKVLADTLRGRIRFAKSEEGRRYLYDRGLPVLEGAVIPESGFYFVRNPDALAKTIPADVRAIIEDPKRFTEGDEAALRGWANEFIRPSGEGIPLEWSTSLENVRLVPEGNVHTALGDAFSSAPRGNVASIVGLLNSAVRASLIYLPYGGIRYVVRNTPQNLVLQTLTHPTAFKKVVTAVRTARKDKPLWDAIVVETGGFPAAAGLPETAIRGVRGAQKAERVVTKGSQRWAGWLSTITDEPWRVSGWMKYADEWGFKGRYQELLDSTDPNVVRVRETISQAVKDDLIDFDTLTPTERESISRYVFVYPFTKGALRWPVTYLRDYQTRAAILGLVASQHEREGAEWGETMVGGKMTALGWLSPISQPQEIISSGVEAVRAAGEGRLDLSAVSGALSPTYRNLMEASGRGGLGAKQIARTWVPGFSTFENVILRDENFEQNVQRFLGTRAWRFSRTAQGKALEWGKKVADVYGGVPGEIVEAKATKDTYESATRGKPDEAKVLWLSNHYVRMHPEYASKRREWEARIVDSDVDGLEQWKSFFQRELGWEGATAVESRMSLIEDLDEWLEAHPDEKGQRDAWVQDIAHANDDRLTGWRKFLEAG